MALTQISTQGIKDGTITGTDLATNVDLVDNQKLRFGTGNDLQIYHDGSNSYLINTTGELNIRDESRIKLRTDQFVLNNHANDENIIYAAANGAVELYHNNSKKLETTSTGIKTTGNVAANETIVQVLHANETQGVGTGFNGLHMIGSNTNVEMTLRSKGSGDIKLQSSANEDMAIFTPDGAVELYHNNIQAARTETNGFSVLGGEGSDANLYLFADEADDLADQWNITALAASSTFKIRNRNTNASYDTNLVCKGDGAVELYHDNSKKFETDTNGITVTGRVLASGTSNIGYAGLDNVKLSLGTSDDLQIYHDGSESVIGNNTGTLQFLSPNEIRYRATTHHFLAYGNDESMAKFIDDGAVELYYDNSKKLKTISEGIKVTELQIAPSGTESNALINFGGGGMVTNSNSYGHFYDRATGGTNTTAVMFRSAGSQVGKIIFNNTSTLYQSGSSDRTLKKNFENWTETILTSFKNLNPQKFNYIQEEDTDSKHKGYIAQDLADKFPEAYPKDPETDKYGFNPSGMVVYLMKAIQELEAEVAALKAS